LPPAPHSPRPDTAVAAEVGGVPGFLLWLRLRDVVLWSGVPSDERKDLFQPVSPEHEGWEREAAVVEALAPAIRTLSALVRYPELVTGADVGAACSAVSAWAAATDRRETALHFAEAAALADPLDASLCAEAGTACVLAAASTPPEADASTAATVSAEADRRAEIWFDRGIRIGRWMGQWEWYIRCLIRAGMQAYELGDFGRARRSYRGARATAVWRGFPDLAGKAHHDMMLIERAVGTYERAETNLYAALSNYPVRYQRLPQLAHDAAYMFVCWGAFRAALEVLDAVDPLIEKPNERIAVMGTLARAAAGTGDRARYREAMADVLLYAALSEINAAAALVLVAEGALDFREWGRSAELAAYGLRIAERRREREPQRRAEMVLGNAAARKIPEYPSVAPERVQRTKVMILDRLTKFRASANPDDIRPPVRAELTKFTMSAR
jgi:hypothetical protein